MSRCLLKFIYLATSIELIEIFPCSTATWDTTSNRFIHPTEACHVNNVLFMSILTITINQQKSKHL